MAVLVPGPFAVPGGLTVAVVPGRRDFGPDVTSRAEEMWQKEKASRPQLFDGAVWSLTGYGCRGGPGPHGEVRRLDMRLQRSSFRYHLLHMEDAKTAATRCCMRWNAMSLSVSALTITRDGCACIGQRSLRVSACQGQWSLMPAGMVDSPDVIEVLSREFHEELGVDLPPLLVGAWEYNTDGECCCFEVLRTPEKGLRFRQEASPGLPAQECGLEPVPDAPGHWQGELSGTPVFRLTLRHVLETDCAILECAASVAPPLAPRKARLVQFEATARRRPAPLHGVGGGRGDVEEVRILGLFEAAPEQGWKPELIFAVRLALNREELLQRVAGSKDGYREHHVVEMVPASSGDQLRRFARTHPCTAVLVGAMRVFEEMRLMADFGHLAGETWDRLAGADDLERRVLARGPLSLTAGLRALVLEGQVAFDADVATRADELAERRCRSGGWSDGRVWCLRHFRWHTAEPRVLELTLQRGRYSYHCLQLEEAKLARSRAQLRCAADAVGVAVAVLTEDNFLCFGQRSIELEACNAMWHLVPTGMLTGGFDQGCSAGATPEAVGGSGCSEERRCADLGLNDWLVARLGSELAVEPPEVGAACALALVECGAEQGWKPDLVLTCRLKLPREELLRRFAGSAKARAKHSQLECVGPLAFVGPQDQERPEEVEQRALQASGALRSFLQTRPVTSIALTAVHLLLQHGRSGEETQGVGASSPVAAPDLHAAG